MTVEYFARSLENEPPEKWQRLGDHLKNVACLAKQFAEPFGGGAWAELVELRI